MQYIPWPHTGRSYDTALAVAICLAVACPAIAGRWYVSTKNEHPRDQLLLVLAAWVRS